MPVSKVNTDTTHSFSPNRRELRLYLPWNLNIKELLLTHATEEELRLLNHIDKMEMFCSHIWYMTHIREDVKKNGYVGVNYKVAEALYGSRNTTMITEFLLRSGVLLTDGHYNDPRYSRSPIPESIGYQFSEKYFSERANLTSCLSDRFENSVLTKREKAILASYPSTKQGKITYSTLRLWSERITIDKPIHTFLSLLQRHKNSYPYQYRSKRVDEVAALVMQSEEYLSEKDTPFNAKGNKGVKRAKGGKGKAPVEQWSLSAVVALKKWVNLLEDKLLEGGFYTRFTLGDYVKNLRIKNKNPLYDFKKLFSDVLWMQAVLSGQYDFFIDDFGKRIHTNFTRLSSHLRGHITVNGEALHYSDIRNSQPFFFAMVIVDELKRNGVDWKDLQNQADGHDLWEYIMLCSQGMFYNDLMDKAGITDQAHRRKFKEQLFEKVFFNQLWRGGAPRGEIARAFQKRFPNVWLMIVEIKRKHGYCEVARKLQTMESSFMLNEVASHVIRNQRKEFLITLHDAFYASVTHIQFVSDTILQLFKYQYGIAPTLEIKECEKMEEFSFGIPVR